MNKREENQAQKMVKEHGKKKRWQRAVSALAAVAVFVTTYAMILPAITWERSLVCELPEHHHDESCYETVTVPAEKQLVCTAEEHVHGEDCYEQVLICTEEELEGHAHGEGCYERTLLCTEEEREGHTHGEDCFNEAGELTCGLEETEGHTHTDACWREDLVCEREETEGHVHSDECYESRLTCTVEEHTHTDDCWEILSEEHEEQILVCELEEHGHTDACFDAPPAEDDGYYCGRIEHTHSEEQYCFFSDGSLRCTIPEHQHTLACKSNPKADVETAAEWEKTFANVELSGNWAEDVIAIAETQLGYFESSRNYEVDEDGVSKRGYTRYGDWYGISYGDWCAMFCSFCLNYAGVDRDVMPYAAGCGAWVRTLSEKGLYHGSDSSYVPKAGDLVFIDMDGNKAAEHVGFVSVGGSEKITTIEGNMENCVCTVERSLADGTIVGYGELPEKPKLNDTAIEERTVESEPASDGAVAVVTGKLPGGAVVEIEAVELSEEQMVRYFGEEKAAAMSGYVAYDITIFADGEEWQPDESVSVVIRHPDIRVSGEGNLSLAHVDSMTQEVSEVEPTLNDNGDIEFTAEGFSLFIAYTVDFHYNELTFSIAGESEILLSELFERLGIEKSVSEIEYVDFSDGNLLRIEQQGEDWLLVSLAPFSTTEQLTLFCADGSIIPIAVTDEQIGGNEYVRFYLDIDSAIPTIQQFEYTITYVGLDFTYDINTKEAATLTSQSPGLVNKTLTMAAGSRIPIFVLNGTNYIKVRETPIEGVHTYVQLGGNPMEERYDAMVGNENTPGIWTWAYGNSEAICYKHMNEESTGQLTIKKEVTGNAPAGQTYQFSVVRHNGTYKWVEEIVTLQAGQTSDPIPYTHTTEYEASPQIWIAELNAPSDATASFSVNGVSATARNRELHWRFEQDVCNYNQTKLKSYQNCKWVVLDTNSNQPDISVVCTNAFPDTNSLIVSKAVSGVTDNATEFQFELTAKTAASPYTPINFAGKPLPSGVTLKQGKSTVLTFKLKNGKSIEFSNLIPNGSLVTLTETSHKNYNVSMEKSGDTQSGDTWQFLLDRDSTVAVTNSAVPVGDIAVKKTVTGGTSSDVYPMQLTIADTSGKIDFTDAAFYGRATIPSGVTRTAVSKDSITFAFSLANDEEIVIGDLVPDGARVTISETGSGNYEPSIAVNGASLDGATRTFSVSGTGTTNIEVTNKLIMLASLTVTKQVSGVHTAQAFPFELQVLNSDDTVPDFTEQQSSLPAGVALKDGTTNVFCFDLADGEHVDFIDILPLNGKLTLTETGNAGYSVTMDTEQMHYSGGSNTFTIGQDMTVCVTNTAGTLLPETGGIGVYPIYASGVLLVAGSIMYGCKLRRKREGRA